MKIPGFNLLNWPTQRELERINAMKAEKYYHRAAIVVHKAHANVIDQQIKEREFLYYLHSGRFPE